MLRIKADPLPVQHKGRNRFALAPDRIVGLSTAWSADANMYPYVGSEEKWQAIDAIQTGNYFEVPCGPHNWLGTPPSVQRLLGMLWLGKQLYPEFAAYDLQEKVMEYYDLFYHCTLTTEQYNALTVHSLHR